MPKEDPEMQKELEKRKQMYDLWVNAGIISPWTAKHFLSTHRAQLIVEKQTHAQKVQKHREVLEEAGISPEEIDLIISKKAPANLAILLAQYTSRREEE